MFATIQTVASWLWRSGPSGGSDGETAPVVRIPRLRLTPSRGLCFRNSPCFYALSSLIGAASVLTVYYSDMQRQVFSLVPAGLLSVLLAWCLVPLAKADYWNITEPAGGVVWTNGQANLISWAKALDDGVSLFDIELQRLSTSGLSYVARHVPDSLSSVNVYIEDLPTGDDYYVMFVNYTHGLLYTSSSTFTISDSANSSSPTPDSSAPTVTVSGAPNPTAQFATTFASAGTRGWTGADGAALHILSITSALLVCMICGAFSIL